MNEFTTWGAFKEALSEKAELNLAFEYEVGKRVHPSFHLTEIKQAPIVSVDCGGAMNSWTEVIVQLWEPQNLTESAGMPVRKALSIIDLVETKISLNPNAVVKIEFGNARFAARQMFPADMEVRDNVLLVRLASDQTQCKALSRGETCGTPAQKPKVRLETIGGTENVCTPGGGCC